LLKIADHFGGFLKRAHYGFVGPVEKQVGYEAVAVLGELEEHPDVV
jgi:hypothetical protein